MKTKRLMLLATLALAALARRTGSADSRLPGATSWSFDKDTPEKPPAGFTFGRTGKGAPGRWVVLREKDAPSGGQVLAQVDADATSYRFPIAVAESPRPRDLRLSVKCKPVSGKEDQACGLVFRERDENNYYITRANALEDNVSLYTVKDGKRKIFANWRGKVASGVWHELGVEARGDHIVVTFDGKKVIDEHNSVLADAGRVGLWTKADSVTYFDALTVRPL
jgi:hypothetical protein